MCLFCAVALGRKGKLDKCFLPTEGRDADITQTCERTISLVAVLHREASLSVLKAWPCQEG